jgi:hypothetical protein
MDEFGAGTPGGDHLTTIDDNEIDPWRARQSTGTRLVLTDTSTPEGLRHAIWCGAGEFYNVALRAMPADSAPQYFLIFHAIELALKAFLIGKGLTTAKLKKPPFGHNLVKLYEIAQKHGLRLPVADVDKFLAWINEYHDRDALIRYEFTTTRTLPMVEVLSPIVAALIDAAK